MGWVLVGVVTPNSLRVFRRDGRVVPEAMPADEMADLLGLTLPERRGYETVAGLVIDALRRLPVTGDVTEAVGWRFEVVDKDGRRIDKVLASRPDAG